MNVLVFFQFSLLLVMSLLFAGLNMWWESEHPVHQGEHQSS